MAERTRVTLEIEMERSKVICIKQRDGAELTEVDCSKLSGELIHVATVTYSVQNECCIIWNGRCYSC